MADLQKMKKWVEKKQWTKLRRQIDKNKEEKLLLAQACAISDADECCNILITLLHDEDKQVQLQAVRSLGMIGNDHATAQLQWLLTQLTPNEKELIDAIHQAIKSMRNKQ